MSATTKLHVVIGEGDAAQTLAFEGRQAWALGCLVDAGEKGATPITHPGPRWSSYVHKLRRIGVVVETVTEKHGCPFRGDHARYVLRSTVRVIGREYAR